MTDPRGAERVARHRAKRDIERLGAMNGWTLVPDATVFTARNGTTVVVGIDGARIPLTLDPAFDTVGDEASTLATPAKAKRHGVRPPDAWPDLPDWRKGWDDFTRFAAEHTLTKQAFVEQAAGWLERQPIKPDLLRKLTRQIRAVTEALPDAPDWYDQLPTFDEEQ